MSKVQDTYKEVKTFTYDNCIVRVHIPDLTEEERERRMKILHKETEIFMKEVIKAGRSNNGKGFTNR